MAFYRDPESREYAVESPGQPQQRGARIRAEIQESAQRFYQTWLVFGGTLLMIGGLSQQGVVLALAVLILLSSVVSRIWSDLSLQRINYAREFSAQRAFWGETVEVTLRLGNHKLLPLPWIRFDDEVPENLWNLADLANTTGESGRAVVRRTTSLAWYERVGWRFRLQCRERGYHRFGPVRLQSSDLFGLFPAQTRMERYDYLLVYPRLVSLERALLPNIRPYGALKGRLRLFEDSSRFRGLRDYQPTDPLKHVDWKATARRQALQVRVYDPTATEHWLLLLDLQTIPHPYQGYIPHVLERAISVVATLAVEGFEREASVGLIANSSLFNSDLPIKILPSRDPRQLHDILEALAVASFLSPFSLAGLLHQEAHRLPFATSFLVVVGLLQEELLSQLYELHREGHPVVLLYVGDDPVPEDYRGMPIHCLGASLAAQGLVA